MTTSSCCVLHHSCRFGQPKYRTLPIILLYSKDEVFRIVEYKPLKLFRVPIFSKVLNIGFNYLGLTVTQKQHPLATLFSLKTLRHPWLWSLWHFRKDSQVFPSFRRKMSCFLYVFRCFHLLHERPLVLLMFFYFFFLLFFLGSAFLILDVLKHSFLKVIGH